MTGPSSTEERIALWLEQEAAGTLPDRVLDASFERTRAIRQAGRSAWRPFSMSRPIQALIAVGAAAIVVALSASLLLPRSETPSVGTSSSPGPSPAVPPLGLALVNLDGTIRQELELPRDTWMADLSADGRTIAFSTATLTFGQCGGCNSERYPAVVQVGSRSGKFIYPSDPAVRQEEISHFAWSPDGTKLAFSAPGADGNVDIYVATLRDNDPVVDGIVQRLTTDPAVDEFPAWSPDGATIYFDNAGLEPLDDSGFSATQEIWSISERGGEPTQLTDNEEPDTQPDVAADGTVAFWRSPDIWRMDSDGSDQMRFTTIPLDAGLNPRWSPDGQKVALLQYDPSERARMEPSLKLPADLPLLKVIVVDTTSGRVTDVGVRVASDVNPVSWTPDGLALLINRYDGPG